METRRILMGLSSVALLLLGQCGGSSDDGDEPRAQALVDCSDYLGCGLGSPSCAAGEECLSIEGCATAICASTTALCGEFCAGGSCEILESYPAQLRCNGEPVRGEETHPDAGSSDAGSGATCEDLQAEFERVRTCSEAAECGQVIESWPACGCTRQPVARADADLSELERLLQATSGEDCGGLGSTCDCPAADGFACVNGACTWNYTSSD